MLMESFVAIWRWLRTSIIETGPVFCDEPPPAGGHPAMPNLHGWAKAALILAQLKDASARGGNRRSWGCDLA